MEVAEQLFIGSRASQELGMISDSLIGILRSTLARVQQKCHLSPDDPAAIELKRSILRTIANLELIKLQKSGGLPLESSQSNRAA
jgi:hypothetical protein